MLIWLDWSHVLPDDAPNRLFMIVCVFLCNICQCFLWFVFCARCCTGCCHVLVIHDRVHGSDMGLKRVRWMLSSNEYSRSDFDGICRDMVDKYIATSSTAPSTEQKSSKNIDVYYKNKLTPSWRALKIFLPCGSGLIWR